MGAQFNESNFSCNKAKMNLEKKQQAGGLEGKDAFDLQELSQALEVKKQAGGCTEDTLLR